MKAAGIIATSLFGALVAAAPMKVVWVTHTDIDIVTIPMTKTVWVGGGGVEATVAVSLGDTTETTPTPSSVAPVSTTPSSVYVAPTTTSVYVAPTTTSSSSSVYVTPTTSSVYVAPTTSSVYVAPTTTSTSVYVAPTTSETPSSTYVAPSTTSSAAAATSSSASSGSGSAASGTEYTGDLTWYEVGEGACGWNNVASDHIVAVSKVIFDSAAYYSANPNNNPLCGRYVSITGKDGSQYQAKVVDRCVGCAEGDLDLSEDFFNTVTENGDGRVSDMSWTWV